MQNIRKNPLKFEIVFLSVAQKWIKDINIFACCELETVHPTENIREDFCAKNITILKLVAMTNGIEVLTGIMVTIL